MNMSVKAPKNSLSTSHLNSTLGQTNDSVLSCGRSVQLDELVNGQANARRIPNTFLNILHNADRLIASPRVRPAEEHHQPRQGRLKDSLQIGILRPAESHSVLHSRVTTRLATNAQQTYKARSSTSNSDPGADDDDIVERHGTSTGYDPEFCDPMALVATSEPQHRTCACSRRS